ncbi:MAG: single-stranded-DNA-specific exonuclease RecJ [Deltaproteobacteria bacterium]|nr:single-stranded-DNA-specific exonuclease RecJ [Deltaproteobacteria bacterium]
MSGHAVVRSWARAELDEAAAHQLTRGLDLSLRACRLLVRRGISDLETARRYLDPRLTDLPDPFSMKDLERAANRVADAIESKARIGLYGDYDVDGVTSTALLASFLRLHELEARVYIPKRLVEGYGLNREAVDVLADEGIEVLLTLDCGITAADEIDHANQRGMDCVVVDHHRCPPKLPRALATLNPQQDDCGYADKGLAAVGVAFNLVIGIRATLRRRGYYASRGMVEPNLKDFLDLVALGTIADMVPLLGVNRIFAWYGVRELRLAQRPGLRALMEVAKVRFLRCDSQDVGFRLGPRINAAGRLADATVGVRLLLTPDIDEARRLAAALDAANGSRQAIEATVFQDAVRRIELSPEMTDAIVLADPSWHPGVVGIVASKLVERYDRPVVLIGEGGRGSARTARGLHLYDALRDVSSHLTKFGGHRAAAGLRIAFQQVDAFRADFLRRVAQDPGDSAESTLVYDDELMAADINDMCLQEILRLAPFGIGNPEPLFRLTSARVKSARVVGKNHLKLRLAEGVRGGLDVIAFRAADLFPSMEPGCSVDIAYHLEENEYAGVVSLALRAREIRMSDDEAKSLP